MKKLKNGRHFVNINRMEKFGSPVYPMSAVLHFLTSMFLQYILVFCPCSTCFQFRNVPEPGNIFN